MCGAGVDHVELEYHLDPPKLFSRKEWHRSVMTHESRDGTRTCYTVGWRGVNGKGIALERLAPLIPYYETVSVMNAAVNELRGLATRK